MYFTIMQSDMAVAAYRPKQVYTNRLVKEVVHFA